MIPPTCDTGLLADRERWETSARGGHRYIKRTTHSLLTPSSPSQRLKELERSTLNGGSLRRSSRLTTRHVGHGVCVCTAKETKSLEIMRKFSEQYAKSSGTYFCIDKSVTAVVIKVRTHTTQLLHICPHALPAHAQPWAPASCTT